MYALKSNFLIPGKEYNLIIGKQLNLTLFYSLKQEEQKSVCLTEERFRPLTPK